MCHEVAVRRSQAASGPSPPKSTTTTPLPSRCRRAESEPASGSASRRRGPRPVASPEGLDGGLLGRLALSHAPLGLAMGEHLPQVTPHRFGAHPLLVAVAKPLLGRGRERQRVGLAGAADQLHLAILRPDRQHHRRERGVQVGADPGGHAGALASV